MAYICEITDWNAPELDVYARLTDQQLRSRLDPERAVLIAESPKVITTALEAGYVPLSLLMERRQMEGPAAALLQRIGADVPVYTGSRELLAGLTGYTLTRGVLCAMRRPPLPSVEAVCAGARRLAVLESVVDATNVGAIFRSAAALGMDAVLVTPTTCDPFSRRAIRVSMGTVFQIPWTRIGAAAGDWPSRGMEQLQALGYETVAMALRDDAIPLDHYRPDGDRPLAILLGAGGDGLSSETVARCTRAVRIPMAHGVDSLNVAAASAVAFWQLRT